MGAITGEAHKFGDHVDTDQIIPARYLISTDEMTGIQALERKAPSLPMRPGKIERREFEYN